MYSAASAVLLNELLKGAISLSIAFRNAVHAHPGVGGDYVPLPSKDELEDGRKVSPASGTENVWNSTRMQLAARKLFSEIFR
jgi:UDP-sugar transporter A1/2/3